MENRLEAVQKFRVSDKKIKVVFVSAMLPSGHYSQILTRALAKQGQLDLTVYTDKNPRNLDIKDCGEIRNIWKKGALFFVDIIKNLVADKPDIVHIQHEMNMYGGLVTATLFPLLPLATKFLGIPTVTTIHGVASMNQINENFINIFGYNTTVIRPWMLKIFFKILFGTVGIASNKVVVHTELIKNVLIKDYGIQTNKIVTIPTAIPHVNNSPEQRDKTFLYYGYMVRRKGLENVIEGFKKFLQKNPASRYKLILAGGVIKGQEIAFEEIKNHINRLDVKDSVEIAGFIEQDKRDLLYNKCYAVVTPAVLSISASGPLYYAYAYGRCPIASQIGNFEEEIQDNVTGIFTENDGWDTAFEKSLNEPELVKKIENNLLNVAKQRSPEVTATKYFKLYETVHSPGKL